MDLESLARDAARKAIESSFPVSLGFLDPEEQETLARALSSNADVVVRRYGGYRGAVRRKAVVMPSYYIDETYDPQVSFFALRGAAAAGGGISSEWATASLRAMGIPRESIGDLFWTGQEWQGVVDAQVFGNGGDGGSDGGGGGGGRGRGRRASGDLEELDPAEVSYPGQVAKTIRATVASMRLDAVAGAGFPASRTRLAQEIRVGRFRINGATCDSPAAHVAQGDVIICRGRGRIVVAEVAGATKRGRISLVLTRYSVQMTDRREDSEDAYAT
jgi:RNA-binding protein YlmH